MRDWGEYERADALCRRSYNTDLVGLVLRFSSKMSGTKCKKLETLERVVNDAARGVHERKGVARTVARIEERAAVAALHLHIKQHGCNGSQ
jgi:hypothetical protein